MKIWDSVYKLHHKWTKQQAEVQRTRLHCNQQGNDTSQGYTTYQELNILYLWTAFTFKNCFCFQEEVNSDWKPCDKCELFLPTKKSLRVHVQVSYHFGLLLSFPFTHPTKKNLCPFLFSFWNGSYAMTLWRAFMRPYGKWRKLMNLIKLEVNKYIFIVKQ